MPFLEEVCKLFPYEQYPNGAVQDSEGNTPYHLLMKCSETPRTIAICKILQGYKINPGLPNKYGEQPLEKLQQSSDKNLMYDILEEVEKNYRNESNFNCTTSNCPENHSASQKSDESDELGVDMINMQINEMLDQLDGQNFEQAPHVSATHETADERDPTIPPSQTTCVHFQANNEPL